MRNTKNTYSRFIPSKSVYFSPTKATICATNYVIQKYSNYPWFNGVLKDAMLDMFDMPADKQFSKPLIMLYDKYHQTYTDYIGYHYLIWKIENYVKSSTNNIYLLYMEMIFYYVIILFGFFIFVFSGRVKSI